MEGKIRCSAFAGVRAFPCLSPAKVERNGKWFCTIHDPDYIRRKTTEQAAKNEAKQAPWVKTHYLHVAAPDMYAALKNMVDLSTPFFSDEPQMEALKQAHAAIAKEDVIHAARAKKDREDILEKLRLTYICGECASPLVLPYDPQTGRVELRCGKDKSHRGAVKQKSLYQLWKEGAALPLEVAQKFMDMKEGKNEKVA